MPLLNTPRHSTGTCIPAVVSLPARLPTEKDLTIFLHIDGIHIEGETTAVGFYGKSWSRALSSKGLTVLATSGDNRIMRLLQIVYNYDFITNVQFDGNPWMAEALLRTRDTEKQLTLRSPSREEILTLGNSGVLFNGTLVAAYPANNDWQHIVHLRRASGILETHVNGQLIWQSPTPQNPNLRSIRPRTGSISAYDYDFSFCRFGQNASANDLNVNKLFTEAKQLLSKFGESF